jgi:hypothetical protein
MSEGGSDNTAVKIIAIIGGVVVVIVLSCGVLGYFGIKAMKEMASGFEETLKQFAEDAQQSQKAVDTFLADIRADKLDSAYQSTTKEFKERLSLKEFEELIKKHPALKERPTSNISTNMNSPNPPGSPQAFPSMYQYTYKAQGKDGKDKIDFTITVEKEDGKMKVDQLTITPDKGGNDEKDEP